MDDEPRPYHAGSRRRAFAADEDQNINLGDEDDPAHRPRQLPPPLAADYVNEVNNLINERRQFWGLFQSGRPPFEASFLRVEKLLRLKIYGHSIQERVHFDANNVEEYEAQVCDHFAAGLELDNVCRFLLAKVLSAPLEPNQLIYEVPNIFQHDPDLLACIFRNPRVFFTCPQGEDSPNDLLKTPARLHNGKWIIERDPIKIIARNQVVGRKRVYSFRYEEMEAGGRAWYLEVFRLNLIHSVAHCLMQNYKIGWAIVRLHEGGADISRNFIDITNILDNMEQQHVQAQPQVQPEIVEDDD